MKRGFFYRNMATKDRKIKWKWGDTVLKYVISSRNRTLSMGDLKTLITNRGGTTGCKSVKVDLQLHLIRFYNVELDKPFDKLTNEQLLVELKLRGLNTESSKQETLIQRLKVEIMSTNAT